jgi:hypothetical protein
MTRFRRTAGMSAAAAVAAGGLALIAPDIASATPSMCSTTYDGNGGAAICTAGTGTYQVRMKCRPRPPLVVWLPAYGPSVPIGQSSVAHCPSGYFAYELTVWFD